MNEQDQAVPPGAAAPGDALAWFADLIPALAERARDFRVPTDVLDDEIWRLFLGQLRRNTPGLVAAVAARDGVRVRELGHALEGTGGTMGLPELSVVGEELCRAAREAAWARCDALAGRFARWSAALLAAREPPHA